LTLIMRVPGLAADQTGDGAVYVGLFKDNAVAVVDSTSGQVSRTIPVPAGPHGLVITPDGSKVYVSSDGDSTVSVIDTNSNAIVKAIDVGPTPHGLTITPDGSRVLVSGFGANAFEVIDTASDEVMGQTPVNQPHNSAISPDGKTAYVGSQLQGATSVVEVDLATISPIATIALDKAPRALNVSPDGRQLYFTLAGADAIQVLDTATNQMLAPIAVGASPHQPFFIPDGTLAAVESQGPGELDIVNPSTSSVAGMVKVGTAPHWAAVSADGRRAYVTNESSNDVSVVDLSSGTVVRTMQVGNGPRKIALRPAQAMAAVSNDAPMSDASMSPHDSMSTHDSRNAAAPDRSLADVRGATELEIEAHDNFFEPATIKGSPGQTVTFEISNEGRSLHNFSITNANINRDVPPGGKIDVAVTFPTSGVLEYFCKFHRGVGMTGRLVVDDGSVPAQ
jgi:YVTN family beta-propeller protein